MRIFALPYFNGEYARVDPFDVIQIRANAFLTAGFLERDTLKSREYCEGIASSYSLTFDLYKYLTEGRDRIWDSLEIRRVSFPLGVDCADILGIHREISPEEKQELSNLLAEDEEEITDEQLFEMRLRVQAWNEINAIARQRR